MSASDLLFPNKYRRAVLSMLLMNPQRTLHLRELARLTGASPGTLKKELDALTEAGLLNVQRVGNQTHFSANVEHPVYPELAGLIRKTTGLCDVLTRALAPLADAVEAAFVFGALASGTEASHSDVDLMVIGPAGFGEVVNAVYEAQAAVGREINPKVMTREEWRAKRNAAHPFVNEVMHKPKLFIVGAEDDL